jgi:hypothetical protein
MSFLTPSGLRPDRRKTKHQHAILTAKQILQHSAPQAAQIVSDLVTGSVGKISYARWEAVKLSLAYHLGTPTKMVQVNDSPEAQQAYSSLIRLAEEVRARQLNQHVLSLPEAACNDYDYNDDDNPLQETVGRIVSSKTDVSYSTLQDDDQSVISQSYFGVSEEIYNDPERPPPP